MPADDTCATCRHWSHYFDEDDGVAVGLCGVPADQLPLSMRGMAMAEKVPVRADLTGCPTHAASQGAEQAGQAIRCPFCGLDGSRHGNALTEGGNQWQLECSCGARGPRSGQEVGRPLDKAVAGWNRRTGQGDGGLGKSGTEPGVRLADFGTRQRFADLHADWQKEIVSLRAAIVSALEQCEVTQIHAVLRQAMPDA